jgi:hypothetical protein
VRELPPGPRLLFNRLPASTTEETFQQFLQQRGIDLPVECISVKPYSRGSTAMIMVPRDITAMLFTWAIDGHKLEGYPVKPETLRNDFTSNPAYSRR